MNKALKSRLCYLLHFIPDKPYIELQYFLHMRKRLRLDPPITFSEKLQWLKLNDRKEFYTDIVDKYNVRPYIEKRIGKEHLVPILGVWERAEDITIDELPNSFVLKCNHDSGSIVICKDKRQFDIEAAKKKLNDCLRQNIYYNGREWPYKKVKPKIIAEVYLVDDKSDDLKDYKLMCFNGEPKCIFTGSNRHKGELYITFFDLEWNRLPFERHYHSDPNEIEKPSCLQEMICLSRVLAQEFPFIRVDFYEVNGAVYFGELTFFPGSGFEEFKPELWDYKLGEWLKLPVEK